VKFFCGCFSWFLFCLPILAERLAEKSICEVIYFVWRGMLNLNQSMINLNQPMRYIVCLMDIDADVDMENAGGGGRRLQRWRMKVCCRWLLRPLLAVVSSIAMAVCLFVCLQNSKFVEFSKCVTCGCCLVLLWHQRNMLPGMYFKCCGWRHVFM